MKLKSHDYDVGADIVRITAGVAVLLIHATDRYLSLPSLSSGISGDILGLLNILGKIAVPLFVLLSGYLLLREDKIDNPSAFYRKRVAHIALPFVVWLGIYFWWMWYWGRYTITPEFILKSLVTGSLLHLYFLPLIAILYLLTPFLGKFLFSLSRQKQYMWCIGLLVAGLFVHLVGYFIPILNTDKFIVTIGLPYIGYYVFGTLARKIHVSLVGKIMLGGLLICSLFLSFLFRYHNLDAYVSHTVSPFIMIESISAFLLILSLGHTLGKLSKKQSSILQYISAAVFGIYLIHPIVLDIIGDKFAIFNPYTIHSPIGLYVLLYLLVGLVVSFGMVSMGKLIPGIKNIFG